MPQPRVYPELYFGEGVMEEVKFNYAVVGNKDAKMLCHFIN